VVEEKVGAVCILEGEMNDLTEDPDVGFVASADDKGEHPFPDELEGLLGAGHQEDVCTGLLRDLFVRCAKGLEEGEDKAQGIAGLIARPFLHICQVIVVLAQQGENLLPLGDKMGGELHGVIILGDWPFAVGDKDPHIQYLIKVPLFPLDL
jgi:hypothetical protein